MNAENYTVRGSKGNRNATNSPAEWVAKFKAGVQGVWLDLMIDSSILRQHKACSIVLAGFLYDDKLNSIPLMKYLGAGWMLDRKWVSCRSGGMAYDPLFKCIL